MIGYDKYFIESLDLENNKFKFTTNNKYFTLNEKSEQILNRQQSSGYIEKLNKKSIPVRNVFCDSESETIYYINNQKTTFDKYKEIEKQENKKLQSTNSLHSESNIFMIQANYVVNINKNTEHIKTYILEHKRKDYNKKTLTVKHEKGFSKSDIIYIKGNQYELLSAFLSDVFYFCNKNSKQISDKKIQNTFIWFHNLKFDILNTGLLQFQNDFNLKLESFNMTKPTFFKYKIDGDKKKLLTFIDSFNFFAQSLEKLGNMIGINKQKEKTDFKTNGNVYQKVDRKFIEYSIIDVVILKETIQGLLKEVKKYGSLKMGVAGTSYNMFRTSFYGQHSIEKIIDNENPEIIYKITEKENNDVLYEEQFRKIPEDKNIKIKTYFKDKIWKHKNLELNYIERLAYFGGRTEIISKLGYIKNVSSIDVNSMYPAMMQKDLPIAYVESYINVPKYKFKILSRKYLMLCKIKVTDNNRIVPSKVNDKTCFVNTKDHVCYLYQPEVELLLKHSENIEILEAHCYKKFPIFKKFSEHFMKEKIKASEEGNEVRKTFSKITVNSPYGKTAERYKSTTIKEIENKEIITSEFITQEGTLDTEYIKIFSGLAIREIDTPFEAINAFTPIAGFVTSYARAEIWKTINKIGFENTVYSDTDSIYYEESKINNSEVFNIIESIKDFNPNKININPHIVDSNCIWDKEDSNINIILHSCKDYLKLDQNMTMIKRKLKGINLKDAIQLDNDIYRYNHWLGINEQLKHGKLNTQIIQPRLKVLEREYNKAYIENLGKDSIEYFVNIDKKIETFKTGIIKPFLLLG